MNIRAICRQASRALRQAAKQPSDEVRLRAEICAVCAEMEQADAVFNNVTDADLIDASVFTMRACEHKLGYLFRQAKAQRAAMAMEANGGRCNQASLMP